MHSDNQMENSKQWDPMDEFMTPPESSAAANLSWQLTVLPVKHPAGEKNSIGLGFGIPKDSDFNPNSAPLLQGKFF